MERIGRYEIEREIGRGAMGVVYLARDPRVRRRLALKTYELPAGIDPELAREYRERFIREAQSAGVLNHPAIVTIYDVDEDPETEASYIAMEYVPGSSLRDCLRTSGRLEPERAILLGTTIAEALHTAHAAGIVHRDIKPDNILVREPDGVFKIADFGIARLSDSELTQAGFLLGSPAYMSPEQIRSREVDGRSDLFSLASVLYEALSGKKPFEGEELPALVYAVVHEDPPPISRLLRALPTRLDDFFARALAKSPEDRFEDGESFALALRRAWKPERRESEPEHRPGSSSGLVDDTGLREPPRQLQVERPLADLPVIPLARTADNPSLETGGQDDQTSVRQRMMIPPRGIRFHRRPGVRLLMVAAALAAAVLWLNLPAPAPDPASVVLDVSNSLEAGTLTVLVDGQLLYVGGLTAERQEAERFGKRVAERSHERFEARVTVPSGEHVMLVRVKPEGEARSYQEQVNVHVKAGGTHRLRIITGRNGDPIPTLRFD